MGPAITKGAIISALAVVSSIKAERLIDSGKRKVNLGECAHVPACDIDRISNIVILFDLRRQSLQGRKLFDIGGFEYEGERTIPITSVAGTRIASI
jgi:hypothetical protein